MQFNYSGENYLKAVLLLHQKQAVVRKVDIAACLNLTKASVSRMIKNLENQGLVVVMESDVCLTEKGTEAANKVYGRFLVIQEFLIRRLGIAPELARGDAGAMEHVISDETFGALARLTQENGKEDEVWFPI